MAALPPILKNLRSISRKIRVCGPCFSFHEVNFKTYYQIAISAFVLFPYSKTQFSLNQLIRTRVTRCLKFRAHVQAYSGFCGVGTDHAVKRVVEGLDLTSTCRWKVLTAIVKSAVSVKHNAAKHKVCVRSKSRRLEVEDSLPGAGGGGAGSRCLTGAELPFGKKKTI